MSGEEWGLEQERETKDGAKSGSGATYLELVLMEKSISMDWFQSVIDQYRNHHILVWYACGSHHYDITIWHHWMNVSIHDASIRWKRPYVSTNIGVAISSIQKYDKEQ